MSYTARAWAHEHPHTCCKRIYSELVIYAAEFEERYDEAMLLLADISWHDELFKDIEAATAYAMLNIFPWAYLNNSFLIYMLHDIHMRCRQREMPEQESFLRCTDRERRPAILEQSFLFFIELNILLLFTQRREDREFRMLLGETAIHAAESFSSSPPSLLKTETEEKSYIHEAMTCSPSFWNTDGADEIKRRRVEAMLRELLPPPTGWSTSP